MEVSHDRELLEAFAGQLHARRAEIHALRPQLAAAAPDRETFQALLRCFHALKGSARCLGFDQLSRHCHQLESVLSLLFEGKLQYEPAIGDRLLQAGDLLQRFADGMADGGDDAALREQLEQNRLFFDALTQAGAAQSAAPRATPFETREPRPGRWSVPAPQPQGAFDQLNNARAVAQLLEELKRELPERQSELEQAVQATLALHRELFTYLPFTEMRLQWHAAALVCIPHGEGRNVRTSALQQELLKLAEIHPGLILIDCSNLTIVFSSLIGTLVSIHKQLTAQRGALALIRVNPQLLKTLGNMGITAILPCADSAEAALRLLQN